MKMNIRQIVSREMEENRNSAHSQKIALFGCGPARLKFLFLILNYGNEDKFFQKLLNNFFFKSFIFFLLIGSKLQICVH